MNTKSKKFSEIVNEAQVLSRRFSDVDPKPWPPEIKVLDLLDKVGNLSKLILHHKGFKKDQGQNSNLSAELALIFFIVLDLADTYEIDFYQAFDKLILDLQSEISSAH